MKTAVVIGVGPKLGLGAQIVPAICGRGLQVIIAGTNKVGYRGSRQGYRMRQQNVALSSKHQPDKEPETGLARIVQVPLTKKASQSHKRPVACLKVDNPGLRAVGRSSDRALLSTFGPHNPISDASCARSEASA
jgi:hypothetical protein